MTVGGPIFGQSEVLGVICGWPKKADFCKESAKPLIRRRSSAQNALVTYFYTYVQLTPTSQ